MQIHTTPCEFLLIQSAKWHSESTGVSHLNIISSFLISSSYPPVFFFAISGSFLRWSRWGANRNLFHLRYTWSVELPNLGALDGYPAFHLDGMESIFPSPASSSGMREKRCNGGRVFLGIKTANFDHSIYGGCV